MPQLGVALWGPYNKGHNYLKSIYGVSCLGKKHMHVYIYISH